jgi:hypothetical protein
MEHSLRNRADDSITQHISKNTLSCRTCSGPTGSPKSRIETAAAWMLGDGAEDTLR